MTTWNRQDGGAPCISFGTASSTWAQFTTRWQQVAAALAASGVRKGDRVAYLGRNRPEMLELFTASAWLGAVFTPLNWRLQEHELGHVLTSADPRVTIATSGSAPLVLAARAAVQHPTDLIVIDDGDDGDDGDPRFSPDPDNYRAWRQGSHRPAQRAFPSSPQDPALLMFTSGTTGLPRGVVHSHASITSMLALRTHYGLDTESVTLIGIPMFHALGLGLALQTLSAGGRVVIPAHAGARHVVAQIAHNQVTTWPTVPAVLQSVFDLTEDRSGALDSLQLVVYSGSPISAHLFDEVSRLDCSVMQVYGLTETMGVTSLSPEDHRDVPTSSGTRSCGRAFESARLRIVDPRTGVDVPDGIYGEIWVTSPTVFTQYRDDPAATAATLTADGWCRTGDGGHLRDGFLYLGDRMKDVIISGGENVSPAETEAALVLHPAVTDAAVVGIPSARWGETVKAFVVLDGTAQDPPTGEQIIEFTRTHLAAYKCPTTVEFLEALPRNSTGKIMRSALRNRTAPARQGQA